MKGVKRGNSQRKKIAERSPEAGGTERTTSYCFMGTPFLLAAMKTTASGDVCTTLGMLLMQLNGIFKND